MSVRDALQLATGGVVTKVDYRAVANLRDRVINDETRHKKPFARPDRIIESIFDLDVEFSAPSYGQLMQDHLLVFKPAVMSRTNSVYLTEKDRKYPVMLESNSFKEKATFNLPAGFAVDEVPNPVSLQTPFGKYATTYEVKGDKLIFTRSLTMSRATVSVDRYKDVRDFFTGMLNAEQSPVVLIRK